jgi:uncharacterized GH25 family protein
MNPIARSATFAVVAWLLCAPALAHEMFLKSEGHVLAPGPEQVVRLVNGTFDISENSIGRDRMADVSIVANGKVVKPASSQWYDDDSSSYLKYAAEAPGTYVLGVSTRPKIIEMSGEDFAKYLKHDGVLDTLESFRNAPVPAKVRERYSKHVRAIVQVGDKRSADYSAPLGYPLEIILEQNPYDLKFGKELGFRVLYRGKPVANQLVYASYEGFHGHDESGEHINAHRIRTDADGRGKFLLSNKALWYLSLIHMQKLDGDRAADYESNWATVTFSVK